MNTILLATVATIGCSAASTPTALTPPPIKPATAVAASTAAALQIGSCGTQQSYMLGPPADYAPRGATGALEVGYLNKDAPIDILVGGVDDTGAARFGVMLGNGDGTFKSPVDYALPPNAEVRSVAFTDFDTDEDLDVVTAGGTRTPQVFLNNGDGTFGEPVSLPAGPGTPMSGHVVVRVEDIHGDAHPDVVTYAGAGFDVWHDSGHATFVASALPAVERLEHGAGLTIADFNRDGATDIAVAGTDRGAAVVVVLLGKRGGVFAGPVRYQAGASGTAAAVVSADVDGNGRSDLAALFTGAGGSTIAVLSGKGDGTFAPLALLPVADATESSTLIAADLNNDGKADLVATTSRGLAVYLSTGKGFAPVALLPASDVRSVAAGDLRGDHMLGVVATRGTGEVTVWPGSCQ